MNYEQKEPLNTLFVRRYHKIGDDARSLELLLCLQFQSSVLAFVHLASDFRALCLDSPAPYHIISDYETYAYILLLLLLLRIGSEARATGPVPRLHPTGDQPKCAVRA